MKKILLLTLTLLGLSLVMFSQDDAIVESLMTAPSLEIEMKSVKFQKEVRPAFSSYIHAEAGKIEKAWKKFIDDRYQIEMKKSKGAYTSEGVMLADISNETLTFYSMINDDENGSRIDVLADFGGKFLNADDHPQEAGKMKAMLSSFVSEFYVSYYEGVLDGQRKQLDKETKTFEKLEKEGEKLQKSIDGKSSDVTKAEENIVKTEKSIADAQIKLEQLKADIENYKSEAEQLKKEVEKNSKEVADQKAMVEKQKMRVEKLKAQKDVIQLGK